MAQANEPGGKQRVILYLFLHQHGNGSKDGCWASVATLAAETGIRRDDIYRELRWLVDNGWAIRETRSGKPSRYWLKVDEPTHKNVGTHQSVGTHKNETPPTHKKATPTYLQKSDTNKIPLTRSPEQEKKGHAPLAPFDLVANAPVAKPKRTTSATDPISRKLLPNTAIPDDLQSLADLLIEFWAAKKGTRSTPVFTRVCNKLRGWPHNDRVTALQNAITNGWGDVFEPRKPFVPRGREQDPGPPMPRPFVRKVLPIDPETGLPDPFADMPYTPKIQ